MHTPLMPRNRLICALTLGLMLLGSLSTAALGQVSVEMKNGQIIISNANHGSQLAVQNAGNSVNASGWIVTDNVGNTYVAGGYQNEGGGDVPPIDDEVIIIGGYQNEGGGDVPPIDDEVIIIGGYQSVLQHFREVYGAVIVHDETLGVDLMAMPGQADPYTTFFNALLTDSLHGHPLVDFFRLIELASLGVFDEPAHVPAVPSGVPHAFPSDLYYKNQWNLDKTGLAKALWHPAAPQQPVSLAIIDSGIGASQQGHAGLDGLAVHHEVVAPTTGFPMGHALGLITLLADRSDDASGISSLLGAWNTDGCYANPALTTAMPPKIFSYNVGDFGPSSVYVARAIRRSIDEGVDIINLSLRLAYSPTVEQAIEEALDQNIIVVAAAGNYAPDAPNKPTVFPANVAGVIAVGSAGQNRGFTATSAREGVDLLAPGKGIVVGAPGNVWYEAAGTSYAAPHVAAALVLLRTVQPGLTPAAALAALQQGAAPSGSKGVGFLNAPGAFDQLLPQQVNWAAMPLPHACGKGAAKRTVAAPAAASFGAPFPALPDAPALDGNYPNPFNPETTVHFRLPARQQVRLSVFNALGQQVRVLADGWFEAGPHEARFAAEGLPSGAYFTRLETGAGVQVRSMVLMK